MNVPPVNVPPMNVPPVNVPPKSLPVLVGESNPYGPDPEFALYPHPRGAAGDRLRRVLGLTDGAYLRRFRRANLLLGRHWHERAAQQAALRLYETVPPEVPVVLLGRRVATAFGFRGPLLRQEGRFYLLPHPSGRSRAWNDPRTAARVRRLLRPVLALPDPDPLVTAVEADEAPPGQTAWRAPPSGRGEARGAGASRASRPPCRALASRHPKQRSESLADDFGANLRGVPKVARPLARYALRTRRVEHGPCHAPTDVFW